MADFCNDPLCLQAFPSAYLRSNSYLVERDGYAVVIDPCRSKELFDALDGLTIDFCLLTHEHYDHINGVNELKRRFGCQVICSEACGERVEDPRLNAARYFPAFSKMQAGEECTDPALIDSKYSCKADLVFQGEMSFMWRGHTFLLRETPGHSPGSICILLDQSVLFSGDTIFAREPANMRFPGGNQEDFQKQARPFLCGLPPETVVYPGHYGSFLLRDAVLK